MKRLIVILIGMLLITGTSAQRKYRAFVVDAGLLLGEIIESDAGVAFPYIEPKYNLNNHISFGLRGEYVLFDKKGFVDFEKSNPYWSDLKGQGDISSLSLIADYYFTTEKVRPFVGAGFGMYLISTRQANIYVKPKENYYSGGSTLRAGVQFNRLRFAGEYNLIPSKSVDVNYFSVKLGFVFGGSKKRFW